MLFTLYAYTIYHKLLKLFCIHFFKNVFYSRIFELLCSYNSINSFCSSICLFFKIVHFLIQVFLFFFFYNTFFDFLDFAVPTFFDNFQCFFLIRALPVCIKFQINHLEPFFIYIYVILSISILKLC